MCNRRFKVSIVWTTIVSKQLTKKINHNRNRTVGSEKIRIQKYNFNSLKPGAQGKLWCSSRRPSERESEGKTCWAAGTHPPGCWSRPLYALRMPVQHLADPGSTSTLLTRAGKSVWGKDMLSCWYSPTRLLITSSLRTPDASSASSRSWIDFKATNSGGHIWSALQWPFSPHKVQTKKQYIIKLIFTEIVKSK